MIYNIKVGAFGGQLRAGDLIGVANVVEHMRKTDITTQFYFCLLYTSPSPRD